MAPGAVARASDRALDLLVVALAAWTAAYEVCLVARLDAGWALLATACLLAAAVWVLVDAPDEAASAPVGRPRPARRGARVTLWAAVALGVAAGALFGLTRAPYLVVWALWIAAGACALAHAALRGEDDDAAAAPAAGRAATRGAWLEPAVVAAWALGLAVLSLFLLAPDADDAYYVHLATWVAAHGTFPLRDVVYSNEVFPALYYPPVSSYEGLVGALSRLSGLSVPDLTYLAVPPLGSALAVLALWRLLRAWRVPMTALALSAALAFLLFDAAHHMTLGAFFVARMWQGKVLLLVVLVPLLFALAHEYAQRPTGRRLALLAAAGAAAVGLSTTAIFVVPVIALGCFAPMAAGSWARLRAAVLAFAVTVASPVAAGVATKLLHGRTPDVYTARDVVPETLVHYVLGTGGFALLGLAAALAGPVRLASSVGARMAAGVALVVGALVAPGVPELIFGLTGLGRVLWRLTWALPVAALVGAAATGLLGRRGPAAVRALPAVALIAAVALLGEPLWSPSAGTSVASRPTWKRPPSEIRDARRILDRARPGDVILARKPLSQTLLVLSGDVTTVSPRAFFTNALRGVPRAHAFERRRLQRLASVGLRRPAGPRRVATVRADLRLLGVDLACVRADRRPVQRVLVAAGLRPVLRLPHTTCLRPARRPARPARAARAQARPPAAPTRRRR